MGNEVTNSNDSPSAIVVLQSNLFQTILYTNIKFSGPDMFFPVCERVYLIKEFKTDGIAMQPSNSVQYSTMFQCRVSQPGNQTEAHGKISV